MRPDGITLITPTHNRQHALDRCIEYMNRQSYNGPLQWVVGDDSDVPCDLSKTTLKDVLHLKLQYPGSARFSFRNNYLVALNEVKYRYIAFIEDDDWYRKDYLENLYKWLQEAPLVGESRAKYYNVRYRQYLIHPNTQHASLCQTGIHESVLPHVLDILVKDGKPETLDSGLWRRRGITEDRKKLTPNSLYVVGIKGLGAEAVGVGHTEQNGFRYRHDVHGGVLRGWVGQDAEYYLQFVKG